ncbi:hypothetical protein A3K63_02130 [Candidatus Micrarchaeota archaeon RBG_16_49_10]|nr:MAG: hypothetical protein A3K63_02130 [Candidatus Micrarchaeota archaeon RBG_16_49_10]
MNRITFLLLILLSFLSLLHFVTALDYCQSISISPSKAGYAPGEQVTITAQGFTGISDIEVLWAEATANLVTQGNWHTISGTFNAGTATWTGTWTIPKNGEYIIAPTFFNSTGESCIGNPGYICSGCHEGTLNGTVSPGSQSCKGCYKGIIVSSNYGRTDGYDMKSYWNISSGYSWNYEGTNSYSSPTANYRSRIAAEERVSLCGHQLLPLRYTKDSEWGYWGPKGHWTRDGLQNLRWLLSYFQPGEDWSSATIGAPFFTVYNYTPTAEDRLGNLGPRAGADVYNVMLEDDPLRSLGDNYYAPYFCTEDNVKLPWSVERVNRYGTWNAGCSFPYWPPGSWDWSTGYWLGEM